MGCFLFDYSLKAKAQLGTDGQKNIDWIDTDDRLMTKTIDQIDGRHKKKNLKPMDR